MTDMTRDEMISKLCIRDDGFHLSGRGIPTLFVTVGGPADKYGDDELALLVEFTEARQVTYRARCGKAKLDWADNFISFDKDVDGYDGRVRWGRKRYSWCQGKMHAPSLPEALSAFWGDQYRDEQVGDFCLLGTGEIVEVLAAMPYAEDREGDFSCRRLTDGAEIAIKRHTVGVVAISGRSIEELGDQMRMAMQHRIAGRPHRDSADEVRIALDAVTTSNDPVALAAMWASRVLAWDETPAPALAA